jgi:Arc/MetJ-type ribon-helix-helix transcriptional regulator
MENLLAFNALFINLRLIWWQFMSDGNKRERITIRLTKRCLDLLNLLIEKGVYNSRNEAIRDALRILYEYHGLKVSPEKKHAFNQAKADDVSKE